MDADGQFGGDGRRSWRIGQLAEATGVSVRTLRHYDEIGLVVPSSRNPAGHRRYLETDVRRLHQAIALRGFGLSLAEVRTVLDDAGSDPGGLLRRQLDQVEDRIQHDQRLRRTLLRALGVLDLMAEPSVSQLVELIEVITVIDRPLTPEQLEELAEGRRRMVEQLSPEQLQEMSRQRERLMDQLDPDELAELNRNRASLMPPTP
jgi:MerR family transcriptional regulator, thiopeptide resistance regulator